MASLDSANGPSDTTRPFLPETTFPSLSRGLPAMALPWSVSRLNQAIHWSETFCISSGERPLCQSVPRNNSMYPFCDCALIFFLSLFLLVNVLSVQCYDERACVVRTIILIILRSGLFPKGRKCCSPYPGRRVNATNAGKVTNFQTFYGRK